MPSCALWNRCPVNGRTFWFQKYVFNPWSSLGKRASWPKLLGGLSFHFFERSEMLVNGPIFRSPSETPWQPFKWALPCCFLRRTEPLPPPTPLNSLSSCQNRKCSWREECSPGSKQVSAVRLQPLAEQWCTEVVGAVVYWGRRRIPKSFRRGERMFPPAFVLHPLPASWCHSHHQCGSVFPSGNWMTESSGDDPRWDFISWVVFL